MKTFHSTLVLVFQLNPLHFSDYLRKETATAEYAVRIPGALKRACDAMAKDMKK